MKINIISIAIILCFATSCTQNRAAEQYEKAMFYLDSLKNTDHYAKINDAIDLLQKSTKAGNAKAQYELGNLYWMNRDSLIPIERDTLMAIQWYEKSADQCYAQAQYSLAYIYENARDNLKNSQRAFDLYKAAADQGFVDALYRMGRIYQYGIKDIVAKNDTIALKYYQQAVDSASTAAMLALGLYYYSENTHKTIDLLQRAAELEHPEAQYRLGLSYMYGIKGIISINHAEAIKWLELAAQNGHIKACNELGDYYVRKYGDDIVKCSEIAFPWYEKSLKIRNNIPAALGYGNTYFKWFVKYSGHNNITQALICAYEASILYAIAEQMADQTYISFMIKDLGMDNFELDLKRTASFYDSATTRFKLGLLSFYIGMTQNDKKALANGKEWLRKAADVGSNEAKNFIEEYY